MADIFISHANEDAAVAKDVCAALEASGVSCWIAPREIRAGADYRSEILRGVAESAALLLLYSPAASRSEHVAREVSLADEGNKPIYPLRIDTHELEGPLRYVLQGKQWVDFRADPAAAVSSVVQAVRGRAPERAPTIKRRGLNPIMLALGALAVLVIGVGGYFGYRSWQVGQTVAACDHEAGSELELDPPRSVGVPFGMIAPGPAVAACARAVEWRPNDAHLRFNLFRALAAATPSETNGLPRRVHAALSASAQAGHVEGVVLLSSLAASDGTDNIVPPPPEVATTALELLVSMALAGDARAQYMLSHTPLPMCAVLDEGEVTPPLTEAERRLFEWVKAEFSRGNPNLAAAVAQAADPAAFNQLAGETGLCGLGPRYLLAHASVQNLAAAQLELSHQALAESTVITTVNWIETRPAVEILAAAVAQDYAPAIFYDAQRSIECKSEQGSPQRADDPAWARLERLAESGYRPAMGEAATLILIGCAPSRVSYETARAWLDRASAGMELDR